MSDHQSQASPPPPPPPPGPTVGGPQQAGGQGQPWQQFPPGTQFKPGTQFAPGSWSRAPGYLGGPARARKNPLATFCIWAGSILCVFGGLILILPFGLFILGGGGNTQRFYEQMAGFFITGGVLFVIGFVLIFLGWLTHARARKRALDEDRSARSASPPPSA